MFGMRTALKKENYSFFPTDYVIDFGKELRNYSLSVQYFC